MSKTHKLGLEISEIETQFNRKSKKEITYTKREEKYKKDMTDMIEYVKWITYETGVLRERIRAAESIISQLRKNGEASVESLIQTLYQLRKKQDKLNQDAETLEFEVKTKEALIKIKEDEKGDLKSTIENEKKEQDAEINKLKMQLDVQKQMIVNQRNLLNHFQVLNEQNCEELYKASSDLQKLENKKE